MRCKSSRSHGKLRFDSTSGPVIVAAEVELYDSLYDDLKFQIERMFTAGEMIVTIWKATLRVQRRLPLIRRRTRHTCFSPNAVRPRRLLPVRLRQLPAVAVAAVHRDQSLPRGSSRSDSERRS
jgi:hypothetical protein